MTPKALIDKFRNSRFIHNASWMMAERIYQMAISLVVGMLTARYLGPTNYGVINYVAAFITFGIPICGLGLEGVLVKSYIDDREHVGETVGTAILLEFLASVIASVVIVAIVSLSNVDDSVKTMVAVLESFKLVFKSTEPIEFWYQAQLKSRYTSTIKMIAYTVMSVYRIILLLLHKSVEWFAFATSVDMLVIAVLYLVIYVQQHNPKLGIALSRGVRLVKESYHFILSSLMVVFYSQMDKIMLQSMLGDTEVGLYSAAYTICNLWFFIPAAIINSARPLIMEAKNKDEKLYIRRLSQLYSTLFWLGVAVAIVVTVFSKLIIHILYGVDYQGASSTLSIGVWYGIFAQLGTARGIWFLSERKNKYVKYCLMWGAVINFVLNYVLIQTIGIDGAAWATLLTQIFVCIFAPMIYRETREHTAILMDGITLGWARHRDRQD